MFTTTIRTCVLTAFLGLAVTASAQTAINFAFRTGDQYLGTSAAPGSTSSDYWNSSQTFFDYFLANEYYNLVDVNGVAGSVKLTESTPVTGNFYLGGIGGNGIAVFDAYAHAGGDSPGMNFTLSGLSARGSYDLYVYVARNLGDAGDIQHDTVSLGGDQRSTAFYGPQNVFSEGTNYILFSGVEASANGEIFFSTIGDTQLNGFTVVGASAIPEPSTYAAFAGFGALGLAVWRRRQRTA